MKYILVIFLQCFCLNSFSQNIPKKADKILIHGVVFSDVVNRLLDSGFVVDKIDKEYQTLQTEYRKACSDCVPLLMFNVRVKDSTATIQGTWKTNANPFQIGKPASNDSYMLFTIQNEKGPVPKKCFSIMNNFALSFNKPVEYLNQ